MDAEAGAGVGRGPAGRSCESGCQAPTWGLLQGA